MPTNSNDADTKLLALGAEFHKAWAAERAAFNACNTDFTNDDGIEAARVVCKDLAEQITALSPVTLDGVRIVAMVWGWSHYLNSKPGQYEGADSNIPCERAANSVMSFLLKDVAA